MSAELERFQALLVEVLGEEPDPERALARLRVHPDAEPFLGWLEQLEPRMVRVAALLVARWQVRG